MDTILLQGHALTLTFKVATQMSGTTRQLNVVIVYVKYFKIRYQITKLLAGHNLAARSCCDLDFQGRDPTFARDTSSQYGDHFCEIVVKFDFKSQSYGYDFAEGSDANVGRDTSAQYSDHFCKIFSKSDIK